MNNLMRRIYWWSLIPVLLYVLGLIMIEEKQAQATDLIASTTVSAVAPDSLAGCLASQKSFSDSYEEITEIIDYAERVNPDSNHSVVADAGSSMTRVAISEAGDNNGNCIGCHSNAGHLIKHVKPAEALPEDGCATATDRPAFLNAFVKPAFTETFHGKIGCTSCHGGDATAEEASSAHVGVTSGSQSCSGCHQDITERHAGSLHYTLNGMRHALELRSGEDNFHAIEPAWEADCASCHAECSDCHINQPEAIGGGLLSGHEFFKTPPMEETCTVCHGSRAGGEYIGSFEGLEPDVHYEAGMHCIDCHKNDLHGDGNEYLSRWEVQDSPRCTDCHAGLPNQSVIAHTSNHEDVSCQVCHSQPYQNCYSCHASIEEGEYFRRADHKALEFKIGRNTSADYPYEIVPLRNNPASRDTFEFFGENLLPHHDKYPTWRTAAPHNIRRVTEQNRSCNNCHGNSDIFLQIDDLQPDGSAANKNSVLDAVP